MGGLVLETNLDEIITRIEEQKMVENKLVGLINVNYDVHQHSDLNFY